jgi:hypothetical protein
MVEMFGVKKKQQNWKYFLNKLSNHNLNVVKYMQVQVGGLLWWIYSQFKNECFSSKLKCWTLTTSIAFTMWLGYVSGVLWVGLVPI